MEENSDIRYNHESLFRIIRDFEESLLRDKQNRLYRIIVETVERPIVETALERTFGNKVKTAKILGINRNTLQAKIKKLGIDVSKYKV